MKPDITKEERLKEIEGWAIGNSIRDKGKFIGTLPAEGQIEWLLSELRGAWEREKIAEEALEFYAKKPQFKIANEDIRITGEKAREALSKIRAGRESK